MTHAIVWICLLHLSQPVAEYASQNTAHSTRSKTSLTQATLATTIDLDKAKQLDPVPADNIATLVKRENHIIRVMGKVHSTYIPKSGNPVILNLGPDFKTCFQAVVFRSQHHRWLDKSAGIIKMYADRTILVDGIVTLYHGLPQIIVTLPSQVRVVRIP